MRITEQHASTPAPLHALSAVQLSRGISERIFKSIEVVDALIRRIGENNPQYNAMVFPMFDEARKQARAADALLLSEHYKGPLHGVPVTVKECIDVKGSPSTWGLPGRKAQFATDDDPVVSKLRSAGAIILGKTNVMQLLVGCESVNPLYGRTSNPWDLNRTSGGTSGGEGSLIAYGGSPLGLGSDIGGSIRTPALFCGIHGLKPTPGRIQTSLPQGIHTVKADAAAMLSVGPMARRVEDLTLAMQVMAENQAQFPIQPDRVDLAKLRIGFCTTDGIVPAAPALRRAVREATYILKESGAQVVDFPLRGTSRMMKSYYNIMCSDGGSGIRRTLDQDPATAQVDHVLRSQQMPTWRRIIFSTLLRLTNQPEVGGIVLPNMGEISAERLQKWVRLREQHQLWFLKELDRQEIDLLLCPPFLTTALPHNASLELSFEGSYGPLFNYLQLPAGVVSLSRVRKGEDKGRAKSKNHVLQALQSIEKDSIGLPVGVQVVGRPNREDQVLKVMSTLEAALEHLPDYPAGKMCLF